MALDSDLLRVDCLVGFEIIQSAARAPRPCTQHAPVVEFPRLPFVHKADNAASEPGAVVFLHAVRADHRVAPAARKNVLMPERRAKEASKTIGSPETIRCSAESAAKSIRAKTVRATKAADEAKLHHDRDRSGGVRWSGEV